MAGEFDHPALANLEPAARAKVEEALKVTLDRQLSRIGGASAVAAHSRSQGAFFSRSKTTDRDFAAQHELDGTLLKQITTLDEAGFNKFSERLAQVKASAKGQPQ